MKNHNQRITLLTIFVAISSGTWWLVLSLGACTVLTTPSATDTPPTKATFAPPLQTSTPILPPAGLIAYLDIDQQLWLVQTDGEARQQVPCEGEALAPAWSPDGRELAYICTSSEGKKSQAMGYKVTDQYQRNIGPATEYLAHVSWSPDGLYVVLDAGTSIMRNLTVLHTSSGQIVHQGIEAMGYAWSPDGRYLAIGQRSPLDDPIAVEPGDSASLAVLEIGRDHPVIVFSGSPEVLYSPKMWLADGRLLYDRLDWDEQNQTGEHALWSITYADDIVGEPQLAANIPLTDDRTAILERLPSRFQDAGTGSFSWSSDHSWLVFHAGIWPDVAVYLWRWGSHEEPHRWLTGHSPQWQPEP